MTAPVGFAGMTHLGLNSAVATAVRGADVVCYDADGDHIAALAAGTPHVLEPGLQEAMAAQAGRLSYSHDLQDLARCALVTIAPDVPTNDQAVSDLDPLRRLIAAVDAALPTDTVLVILSQVPPGFCRALTLRPGRVLYYQVETLIFGQALHRALYPERFILGCADPAAPLHPAFAAFLELFDCPLLPMRYESAELAKISINCCLVASISVANTLAELCEHTGADWREIAPALKLDKRIGPHAYLAPGLGIAGGNLERDLHTVLRLAEEKGIHAEVVRAWTANSTYRRHWVLRALHRHLFPHVPTPTLAVWGLAYKQDTHSTKNAPSLALLAHLDAFPVRVFDPAVRATDVPELSLIQATDPLDACTGADALLIMTPWPLFAAQDPVSVRARLRGTLIIDPYDMLDGAATAAAGLCRLTLGATHGENHADTHP